MQKIDSMTMPGAHHIHALRIKMLNMDLPAAQVCHALANETGDPILVRRYADQLAELGYAEIPAGNARDARRWRSALVALGATVQTV